MDFTVAHRAKPDYRKWMIITFVMMAIWVTYLRTIITFIRSFYFPLSDSFTKCLSSFILYTLSLVPKIHQVIGSFLTPACATPFIFKYAEGIISAAFLSFPYALVAINSILVSFLPSMYSFIYLIFIALIVSLVSSSSRLSVCLSPLFLVFIERVFGFKHRNIIAYV